MTLADRRRALIAQQKKIVPKNRFVEGSFTRGTSAWTVDANGDVVFSALKGNAENRPYVQMIRKIYISSGDTVRLVIKRKAGSVSAAQFVDLWVCGYQIASNKSWGTGSTPIDVSGTAGAASSNAYLTINNRSGTASYSSYKVSVEVYVNGTKVFPEA